MPFSDRSARAHRIRFGAVIHDFMHRAAPTLALLFLVGCSCSGSSNPDDGGRTDGAPPTDAPFDGESFGDGGDAGDTEEIPEDVREFLEARRQAECDRAVRCEGGYGFASGPVCHPDRVEDWLDELPADVTLNPELAEQCLDELSAPCDGRPIELFTSGPCTAAVQGSLPVGEPCDPNGLASSNLCADGLYCPPSGCPTCTSRRSLGESCVSFTDCADDLACMGLADGESRCVRLRELGETCGEGDLCAVPVMDLRWICDGTCREAVEGESCGPLVGRCATGLGCVGGTCLVLGDEGDACPCDDDLLCIGGTCSVPERELGSACERNAHCAAPAAFCVSGRCSDDFRGANCLLDSECGQGARCRFGTCAPLLAIGDACAPFELCPLNARCDDGVCRLQVPPDGTCSAEVVCPHGFACEESRCVALPTIGEPCTDRCATGTCRDGTCVVGVAGDACSHGFFTPNDSLEECEHGCEGFTCGEPSPLGALCRSCVEGAVCARRPDGAICVPATCE